LADPVCNAFVQHRVFERVRANMHECSRQRVCALMQEFRKHQRGVLSAATGRGDRLQKIVDYSYGLRGQRKWAFHRAYNLSMHHNTVTGPPWPAAAYDARFGWKTELKGQLMVMQTAAPLPLPLLEHLQEMMSTCPRAERRMYECIVHVPRTPLVPLQQPPPLHSDRRGALAAAHDESQSPEVSMSKDDFSVVEVKQSRRSKSRYTRKTNHDRKFLTNGDLVSVCKSFGRKVVADDTSVGEGQSESSQVEHGASATKVSVRSQLKDALLQLRQAREELQRLQAGVRAPALQLHATAPVNLMGAATRAIRSSTHDASCSAAARTNAASLAPTAPLGGANGRVYYAALPHPLAFIPGTKEAVAAAAAAAATSSATLGFSSSVAAATPLEGAAVRRPNVRRHSANVNNRISSTNNDNK